jgi:dipeptide transport system ATP-binding protein
VTPTGLVSAHNLRQVYTIGRVLLRAGRQIEAVRGVSLDISAGRTLAVVGESGSGKSTLGRMIGLIEPPASGTLMIDGIDVAAATPEEHKRLRRTVQFVFQNPFASLNPRHRIRTILEQPLIANVPLDRAERIKRISSIMAHVGLRPEHADRYPHMFSVGQRQRIAIARALILDPRLVVADEPVSSLDVSIQAQVLNLLGDLQRDMGVAYLFISHDLNVVRHIAHDVLVLYLGTAIEQGPKAQVLGRPLHPYTRALLASTPDTSRPKGSRQVLRGELPSPFNPPHGCVFSTRCPSVTERCRVERPFLRKIEGRSVACHFAEDFART